MTPKYSRISYDVELPITYLIFCVAASFVIQGRDKHSSVMNTCLLYGNTGSLRFVEPSRQSDWDSILACHRGELQATTWHLQRSTMGAHHLKPTGPKEGRERKLACALVSKSCIRFHPNLNEPFSVCFSQNVATVA